MEKLFIDKKNPYFTIREEKNINILIRVQKFHNFGTFKLE